jgi:hypothetical protein
MKNSDLVLETDGSLSKAIVVKIGNSENINATALDFVNQLVAG